MSKKYKFKDNDKLYFVTLTINKWIDLFIRNEYKNIFLESITYCQKTKGLEIYGWVIMTSHIHMIIGSNKENLSNILRDLKKYTSKKIKEFLFSINIESRKEWFLKLLVDNKGNFRLWLPENHPIELDNNKIIDQKLDYIHKNPINAGFIEKEEDWLYSSAKDYFCNQKGLIDINFI